MQRTASVPPVSEMARSLGPRRSLVERNHGIDRRAERTRRALGEALIALLKERCYDSIRTADISDMANVGRSTFYEHYKSKDELLLVNAEWLLRVLAEPARQAWRPEPLVDAVNHIWNHRAIIRSLSAQAVFPALRRSLTGTIADHLSA